MHPDFEKKAPKTVEVRIYTYYHCIAFTACLMLPSLPQ